MEVLMIIKNKILISSIITLCILVGVSFTSVVGYSSVDSDVKASPLFTIRSSRAIDEESKGLTSNYIGIGKPIKFILPERDSNNELLQKVINLFKNMNEKSSDRIILLVIHKMHEEGKIDDRDIQKTYNIFKQIIDGNNIYTNYLDDSNPLPETTVISIGECYFPFCTIYNVFWILLIIFVMVFFGFTLVCVP